VGIRTTQNSKKLAASDCSSGRQPEIAIRLPEPYLYLWNNDRQRRNYNGTAGILDHGERNKCRQVNATKIDNQKWQYRPSRRQPSHFRHWLHFYRVRHDRKWRICGCNFVDICHFLRYKYFLLGWPHCYFWLSVVFQITVFEVAMVNSLRFTVEKNWHFSFSQVNVNISSKILFHCKYYQIYLLSEVTKQAQQKLLHSFDLFKKAAAKHGLSELRHVTMTYRNIQQQIIIIPRVTAKIITQVVTRTDIPNISIKQIPLWFAIFRQQA